MCIKYLILVLFCGIIVGKIGGQYVFTQAKSQK